MSVLSFTLSDDGVSSLRDALICLNKFHDEVSLEAQRDKFMLSALNPTKSAYASFSFNTSRFFSRYKFNSSSGSEKFYCRLYSRVLIALFRARGGGSGGDGSGKDGSGGDRGATIDHCTVSIEDGPSVKSRMVVRIAFRNGCVATHRLTFESAVVVHARFNAEEATHRWTIASRTLRQIMEHFGPGVELLDINSDEDHINFNCYMEKALNADEVLKKPLQTSIAVDLDEFEDIDVENGLHIIISVRDFRAVVQHAGILSADLQARYSIPERPIRFSYDGDAVSCEFLLMTVGERGSTTTAAQRAKRKKAENATAAAPVLDAAAATGAAAVSVNSANPRSDRQRPPPVMVAVADRRATPVHLSPNAGSRTTANRATVLAMDNAQPAVPAVGIMPPPSRGGRAEKRSGQEQAQQKEQQQHQSADASRTRMSFFDIRPQASQVAPPRASAVALEDGLFVGDDGWEPVRVGEDEDEAEDGFTGLGWDNSSRDDSTMPAQGDRAPPNEQRNEESLGSQDGLEPTQRLSDVQKHGLFYGM
ncbi:DNA repair protein rad9 [Ceratocystis fimbriata CBS 114723]|uniref:DNA repair protein rad9 n=1 Tax=Ceratocystis fimbriata CBS 114723 TaxID=1035309 RepID=A0A2C5WTY8_9PEZI|nr:DNA repair protein rad9 [Ceratocystis fimbriata CBS 114723]